MSDQSPLINAPASVGLRKGYGRLSRVCAAALTGVSQPARLT
jgi:hypothetical protein